MCSLRPLLTLFIGFVLLTKLSAAESLPPDLKEPLERNAKELSPLSVKWKQELRPLFSEKKTAELLKLQGPLSKHLTTPQERELTFEDTKIRAWVDSPIWGVREYSFDGNILYIGNHDQPGAQAAIGAQPTLSKLKVDRVADEYPGERWMGMEYFDTTGFWFPQTSEELSERVPPATALLKLLSGDGKLLSIDKPDASGLIRVLVEAPDPTPARYQKKDLQKYEANLRNGLNSDEFIAAELEAIKRMQNLPPRQQYAFFLDPAHGHAVARYQELTQKGELLLDAQHSQFEKIEGRQLWLPRRSVIKYYTFNSIAGTALKEAVLERTFEVSSIKPPPRDFQFALDYRMPGTFINDESGDKPSRTQIPGR